MGANSAIEWCHHTFNPWWGCVKISPGCDSCYAERDAFRYAPKMRLWGEGSTRREFSDAHWQQPVKWNARAARDAGSCRVFCASMADVFDKDGPADARARLWDLIRATPALDWLLLTKRIGNAPRMLPPDWGDGWPNVWLGISVVNQDEVDRDLPKLLGIPAQIHWLSCEPLLASISLAFAFDDHERYVIERRRAGLPYQRRFIDWVVVGGESGPRARGMGLPWARALIAQCAAACVPCFMKQLGTKPFDTHPDDPTRRRELKPRNRKGGDPFEWPDDLRVRQFPTIDFGALPV